MPPLLLGLALVFGIAGTNGGFSATTWGWPALVLLPATVVALAVRESVSLTRPQLALLALVAALVAWTALSSLWSTGIGVPLLETERSALYLAVLAAAFLVVPARSPAPLAAGVAAGCVGVCCWALVERLLPGSPPAADVVEGYRLSGPVGYANGLGLLAAIGALLAAGFAAEARRPPVRAVAACALVPLLAALTLTSSRGSWLALALGAAVLVALLPDPARALPRLGAAAVAPALAAWLATRATALTQTGAPFEAVRRDGHRLALLLVGLAVLAVGLALCVDRLPEPRPTPRTKRVMALVGLVLVVAAGTTVAVRAGGPVDAVHRALSAFRSDDAGSSGGGRVLSLSGSGRSDYWRVAWREASAHPLLGGGAGSFGAWWLRLRPTSFGALDAHELYLETLAELGAVGLALLLAALAVPLTALQRARRAPLGAACGAAYAAFLLHAALDWDWELPGVTAAGLLCGAALLSGESERGVVPGVRGRAALAATAVALVGFVLVLHVGNVALAASDSARDGGDFSAAVDAARRADRWQPWSSQPQLALGEAQLAAGRLANAAASFGTAIRRDPGDWELWYELGLATQEQRRARALATARRLNPRSPELAELGS